jgi:hypothetical protein
MATRRWVSAVAMVVGGVLAGTAPAATAGAPVRQVFAGVDSRVDHFCGFPVLARAEGRVAVIDFFDANGNLVKSIQPVAGRLQTTVTNLDTGTTITLHASGPGILELSPDGDFVSFTTLGAWFVTQDPTTGERGDFLLQGRRELNAETGFEFHGRVVDLCAELAGPA